MEFSTWSDVKEVVMLDPRSVVDDEDKRRLEAGRNALYKHRTHWLLCHGEAWFYLAKGNACSEMEHSNVLKQLVRSPGFKVYDSGCADGILARVGFGDLWGSVVVLVEQWGMEDAALQSVDLCVEGFAGI